MPETRTGRLQAASIYALLALVVGAVAAVIGVGLWSSSQADRQVADRQQAVFRASLQEYLGTFSRSVEPFATAPEIGVDFPAAGTAEWMQVLAPTIGSVGVDTLLVFDTADRLTAYLSDGAVTDPATNPPAAQQVLPILDALRNAPSGAPGATPAVTDYMVIDGTPAAVVAKPLDTIDDTGGQLRFVALSFVDDATLLQIGEAQQLEDISFSVEPGADDRSDVPLVNNAGETIGHITYLPFTPGANVLSSVAPGLLAALVLGAGMGAWLITRWRRASGQAQRSEAKAQHLAFHDTLTGLPNRALFNDRLEQALARVRQGGRPLGLLYLDLDRFKTINDTLGHLAGDALLREVSNRLLSMLKETDTLARLGGDEFGIIYTDVASTAEIQFFCAELGEAVQQPFSLMGTETFIGLSIGVAMAPDVGSQRDDLVRKADIALYRAKNEGRNCYRVFEPEMDRTIQEKRTIEQALRGALEQGNQLEVHYQPLYSSKGKNEVVGVEALLRWNHPELGVLPPAQFVPIAEESGLIHPLGEWVLRTACRAAVQWPIHTVAVNVSPVQFRVPGFADKVLGILRETGLEPTRLELEITENMLVDYGGSALQRLRAAGVRIALDDFGTGYSSLSYLGQYAVDKIKIDKSFVESLTHKPEDAKAIVIAMVELARAMGISVTAEGVETNAQREFLSSIGCDELQGFLFSKAVPANSIQDLLFRTAAAKLRLVGGQNAAPDDAEKKIAG